MYTCGKNPSYLHRIIVRDSLLEQNFFLLAKDTFWWQNILVGRSYTFGTESSLWFDLMVTGAEPVVKLRHSLLPPRQLFHDVLDMLLRARLTLMLLLRRHTLLHGRPGTTSIGQ